MPLSLLFFIKLRDSAAPHRGGFPKDTFLFAVVLSSPHPVFPFSNPTHPQEFQQSLGPTS